MKTTASYSTATFRLQTERDRKGPFVIFEARSSVSELTPDEARDLARELIHAADSADKETSE